MAQFVNKLRDCVRTVNLTMLLVLNLFFIVTLNLTVATVLVVLEADHGFFIQDGSVSIGGALVILYASCILMAISLVVAIRLVLIKPIKNIIQAMNRLAAGDFTVRLQPAAHGYEPTEIRAFKAAFNKAAEELSGTELLRKDFVNNFSHEFKTPIVSISGFADLLLDEDVTPEEQREYLQIIRDESKRLAQLSGSVLLLNRIEAQTILTDCTDFSLDEQLRQCILVTRQKWRDKPLQFEAELAPCTYHGSEALVKEIWLNLLDNAATVINGGTVDEPDAQPDRLPLSSVTYPSEGDRYATITISGTNVDAPVYYGDTSKILNAGVGTYKDDSRVGIPGEGKTILLAGHNNTFFNDLQHAEAGATVTITTHYGVYTYEVTGTEILDYQDETAYDFTRTDENLILYTCYPFDALGFTPNRFFVYAKYVSGPVLDANS